MKLFNNTSTKPDSRDTIRISKDSVVSMYVVDMRSKMRNITLTYLLEFETKTTVHVTISAVEDSGSEAISENTTLEVPDLNRASTIGVRTERHTKSE